MLINIFYVQVVFPKEKVTKKEGEPFCSKTSLLRLSSSEIGIKLGTQ